MNEAKTPTLESIEAALKTYDANRAQKAAAVDKDSQAFIKLVGNNERLKREIFNVIKFLIDIDVPLELTCLNLVIFKFNELCEVFFWVGWHARGAAEQSVGLKRMAAR